MKTVKVPGVVGIRQANFAKKLEKLNGREIHNSSYRGYHPHDKSLMTIRVGRRYFVCPPEWVHDDKGEE